MEESQKNILQKYKKIKKRN